MGHHLKNKKWDVREKNDGRNFSKRKSLSREDLKEKIEKKRGNQNRKSRHNGNDQSTVKNRKNLGSQQSRGRTRCRRKTHDKNQKIAPAPIGKVLDFANRVFDIAKKNPDELLKWRGQVGQLHARIMAFLKGCVQPNHHVEGGFIGR